MDQFDRFIMDMNATPRYGMFTEFGNDAVHAIVRSARVLNMSWPDVQQELYALAKRFPNDFAEATDTDVMDHVYSALGFDR